MRVRYEIILFNQRCLAFIKNCSPFPYSFTTALDSQIEF
ncbi:hypothetical protein BofuT4_uP150820.1 [Botrytis cinerea T4]|uniref:Uncharacterized protein n=1 Tax=Botryotinia fuckeliana (strain T4) TaxID=999810 RepID=G2YWF2_BOTF4|nr:hypothetical protein BofuT4_uP150820.1 [Botrytis cinerea T4]